MSKVERIVFLVLGGIVWTYLGLRAAHVPLVHDEVVTYIAYIRDATFIPPWSYWDANNHLLNSGVSALLTQIFGNGPFAIRMASWLSFLGLLYFLYKIVRFIPNLFNRWALIVPLMSAAYFIEFYGLTRGYGMGIACFLGTLYFAFLYARNGDRKHLVFTSLFGVLAALGSLSLIVVVGIIYVWILGFWIQEEKKISTTLVKWFGIYILPLLPLVFYVFQLKERGLLYYGGDDFIDISLKPFAEMFLITRDLWWVWIVLLVLILSFYGFLIVKRGWNKIHGPSQLFAFTFVVSLVAIFAQHWVLGVNYPADRAALYLFPLLLLTLVFIPSTEGQVLPVILFAVTLWFPIQTISSANLKYSKFWIYEYVPVEFIDQVNHSSFNDYPPSVNGYFLRKYIWDYAQLNNGRTFPSTINGTEHPDEWADFMLVDSNRIKKVNLNRFKTINYDPISGQSLLQQKFPNKEIIREDTLIHDVVIENEFTNIFEFRNASDWAGKPMAMYFNVDVKASSKIMHALVISSVFDTNGVEVYTNKYMFDQVSENWSNTKDWKIKMYLPPFPKSVGRFVTYIYNPKKEKHVFPKIECKLAEIQQQFE